VQDAPEEEFEQRRSAGREAVASSELLDEDFETVSGTPVEPEYGPGDWSVISDTGNAATYGEGAAYGNAATHGEVIDLAARKLRWPRCPAYTRGPCGSHRTRSTAKSRRSSWC
jgi:hypothetical protein